MSQSFRLLKLSRFGGLIRSSKNALQVAGLRGQSVAVPCLNFCSYKSLIALERLYPNSSLNIAKAPQIPVSTPDDVKFSGFIPMDKIKITYCRSSGPGGMNVNCVNTKVDVRFHLDTADWIPSTIRNNMKIKLRTSTTKEGFLIVTSDRTRSQHFNTADALEKLREQIRSCEPEEISEPTPETLEKLRRKSERAARERLREKRTRHNIKSTRGASSDD